MALTKQISKRGMILSPTNAEVSTAQTIAPYYDFRIDGALSIPVGSSFDAARYIDAPQTISIAVVSVGVGGTSQYRIVVTSYDASGGTPVEHINVLSAFTVSNSRTSIAIAIPAIAADRTLKMTVTEEIIGTSCEDFCLTLVSGKFADLSAITNGHTILDEVPATFTQRQNLQFVGGDVVDDVGNDRTIVTVHPIGGIYRASLTLVQFQNQMGTGWVLANGGSAVGSAYQTLTGNATVPNIVDPDGLAVFIRIN